MHKLRTPKVGVDLDVIILFAYFQEATVVLFRVDEDGTYLRSTHATKGRSISDLSKFHLWDQPKDLKNNDADSEPIKYYCAFIEIEKMISPKDSSKVRQRSHIVNLVSLDQLESDGLALLSTNYIHKTPIFYSEMPHFNSVDEAVFFMASQIENMNTVDSSKTSSDKLKDLYSKLDRAYQSDISARSQWVKIRKFQFNDPVDKQFADRFGKQLDSKHQEQKEILKEAYKQLSTSFQTRETSAANNTGSVSSVSSKQDSTQRQHRKEAQQSSKIIQ